jgi:hypothetical protein
MAEEDAGWVRRGEGIAWRERGEARGEAEARADGGRTRERMKGLMGFFLHFILFSSRDY